MLSADLKGKERERGEEGGESVYTDKGTIDISATGIIDKKNGIIKDTGLTSEMEEMMSETGTTSEMSELFPDRRLYTLGDGNFETMSITSLPATTSLPSFTLGKDDNSLNKDKIKKPREKLTTVLKQSERLIRDTLGFAKTINNATTTTTTATNTTAAKSAPRKMDMFIQSLKEEKIRKRVLGETFKNRLTGMVPSEILSRKPRLSAENKPGDDLEITVNGTDGNGNKNGKVPGQSMSLKLVRQVIAPRVKKTGISKLNAELDRKIQTQQQNENKLGQAKIRKSDGRNRKKDLEREEQEQEEKEEDREFGKSESDNEDKDEDDTRIAMENANLQMKVKIKSNFINSDDEEDEYGSKGGNNFQQPDFKRSKRIIAQDLHEEEEEEDLFKKTQRYPINAANNDYESDHESDEDSVVDDDAKIMDLADENLSFMLSGKFTNDNDKGDGKEKDNGNDEDKEIDFEFQESSKRPSRQTFLEEEAEDEDSQVSADEFDEEAIAKELKESKFLVDEDDESEEEDDDGEEKRDTLEIHKSLRMAEEEAELEFLVNRFVPEKVIREQGAYAEIRKKYKYTEEDDEDDDIDDEEYNKRSRNDMTTSLNGKKSKFGKLERLLVNVGKESRSHPDFLKLLKQDLIDSEGEEEEKDKESRQSDMIDKKDSDDGDDYYNDDNDNENDDYNDDYNENNDNDYTSFNYKEKHDGKEEVIIGEKSINDGGHDEKMKPIALTSLDTVLDTLLQKSTVSIGGVETKVTTGTTKASSFFSNQNRKMLERGGNHHYYNSNSSFSNVDDHLQARLQAKENREDALMGTNDGSKKTKSTFEAVSARPTIVKERMRNGKR